MVFFSFFALIKLLREIISLRDVKMTVWKISDADSHSKKDKKAA